MHHIPRLFRIIILFVMCFGPPAFSQIGGDGTYKFLTIPNSARIAAIGGNFLAINDNDITLTQANPSLISPEMHNNLALSYVNTAGGVNYGFVMYSRNFSKAGSFVGSLQFVNYGNFQGADASGNLTGEFGASEYAFNVGWGRKLSQVFFIGANAKLVYSHLESYNSFGIAVDVAGTYSSKDRLFTASLIGRNIGYQIVPYVAGTRDPLPFELQIGLSEQFRHIPLRFFQMFTNLQKWDLTYTDPNDPNNQPDPITGETKEKTTMGKVADGFMRHVVLGAELTIAKVFSVRVGYNYQRRQELKLSGKAGLAGFSAGFGLRIKMFNLSYTRSVYQAGSMNPNYITLGVNFQEFTKKQ